MIERDVSRRTLLGGVVGIGAVILGGCAGAAKSEVQWQQLSTGEARDLGSIVWQAFAADPQATSNQRTWNTAAFLDATEADLARMSHVGVLFTDPGEHVHMAMLEQNSWLRRTRAGRRGIGFKIGNQATKLGLTCIAPSTGESRTIPLTTVQTVGGIGQTYNRKHLPNNLSKVHIL